MEEVKEGQTSNDVTDRISQLPVPILHRVLSFLEVKDAFRSSVLSKKWNAVCVPLQLLNFSRFLPVPTSDDDPAAILASVSASSIRSLDRSESMTMPEDSRLKRSHFNLSHVGWTPVPKKPKTEDPNMRDMAYGEKQKLTANLQSIPPEKLDTIVQILKKRSMSLSKHDDEIEVDIDSVDAETLWELDRFVTNYKKSLSKILPSVSASSIRSLDRSESMTMPVERSYLNHSHVGWIGVPKKLKAEDPNKRNMTYAEKQELSTNLQSIPPEKRDSIIQNIKKRSTALGQHDDNDIELEIEKLDSETLWELDRFVTNYKESLSKFCSSSSSSDSSSSTDSDSDCSSA